MEYHGFVIETPVQVCEVATVNFPEELTAEEYPIFAEVFHNIMEHRPVTFGWDMKFSSRHLRVFTEISTGQHLTEMFRRVIEAYCLTKQQTSKDGKMPLCIKSIQPPKSQALH